MGVVAEIPRGLDNANEGELATSLFYASGRAISSPVKA